MQGMMVSERPASIATGMVDSSVSIGNYKGVMLCNRPFAGASAGAPAPGGGPAKAQFACGKVPEAVGLNRKQNDMTEIKRTKKETALTRHRKWLADLQRTKQEVERQEAEEKRGKDDQKRRFMEQQASLRKVTTEGKGDGGEDSGVAATSDPMSLESPLLAEAKEAKEAKDAKDAKDAAAKRRAKQGRPAKPMWALTETKAAEAEAEADEGELDDLLEFAAGLDFDKFEADMEVNAMLEQVKKRIVELEAMKDEEFEEEEEKEAKRGENRPTTLTAEKIAALQKKFGVSSAPAQAKDSEDDETRSVAASVLSENKELGNIHSRKSVAAIASARREDKSADGPRAPPTIAQHPVDGGTRLGNKDSVQKLPYMNRNPSV
eukprot:CAMPEP_0172583386 /NCGR_PEP_ID=MMETSP1068-20121228/3011_1 /TAXON_ID=35684 /ORGANISM="Pseudopedinella elastica, Strain CCMP716" /LENGTH=376 /DNA_ID=CAMNT_0013377153 /DNA_START=248 /DNA_END=1378 /DNA_ORIENTATION=+